MGEGCGEGLIGKAVGPGPESRQGGGGGVTGTTNGEVELGGMREGPDGVGGVTVAACQGHRRQGC